MNSGRASRIFIIGIRLWPPLRIFAPSPCSCKRAIASEMDSGRKYSKDWGIIFSPHQASNDFQSRTAENSHANSRPSLGDTLLGVLYGETRAADAQTSRAKRILSRIKFLNKKFIFAVWRRD